MCGIYGIFPARAGGQALAQAVRGVSGLLAHRGPDAMGLTVLPGGAAEALPPPVTARKGPGSPGCPPLSQEALSGCLGVLGHHRLSIIDLAEAADQPMHSADGRLAISFNGEIYNYLELREELARAGQRFRTASDTEVALAAFRAWGPECFARFNGDFAMLIYDAAERTLHGARDRLGVKPLFFLNDAEALVFSSEVKGFLGLPWFTPALNERLAYHYLVADFPLAWTLGESFLAGVRSLPAGSWFRWRPGEAGLRPVAYWSPGGDGQQAPADEDECVERFDQLLRDAVRLRLRSDMPVGAFLSGGMDSTALVRHAVDLGASLPTFSSVFPGWPEDESGAIALAARSLGVSNVASPLDAQGFADQVRELVWLQDEPFSTLNVYSQWRNIALAAGSGLTVMLDGGGADEYLAGYADYAPLAAADLGEEGEEARRIREGDPEGLARWREARNPAARRVAYIDPEARRRFRGDAGALDRPFPADYAGSFRSSRLKHALRGSLAHAWMNKSIAWANRYIDRSGMRLGVELRVPYQDHRLVDYCLALPPGLLAGGGLTKRVLRRSMRGRLPSAIVDNTVKNGFAFPFCRLLAENAAFRSLFLDLASGPGFDGLGLFSPQAVRRELDGIIQGRSADYNLWRVFNLHLWQHLYLQGTVSDALGN